MLAYVVVVVVCGIATVASYKQTSAESLLELKRAISSTARSSGPLKLVEAGSVMAERLDEADFNCFISGSSSPEA